jgi:hypothetical protein
MRTSGHGGNDAWMIMVPVGVLLTFGVILFGGPREALDAVNAIVGETVRATIGVVSGLFS